MFAALGKAGPFFGRMHWGLKGRTKACSPGCSPVPHPPWAHPEISQAGWVIPLSPCLRAGFALRNQFEGRAVVCPF